MSMEGISRSSTIQTGRGCKPKQSLPCHCALAEQRRCWVVDGWCAQKIPAARYLSDGLEKYRHDKTLPSTFLPEARHFQTAVWYVGSYLGRARAYLTCILYGEGNLAQPAPGTSSLGQRNHGILDEVIRQ